MNMLVKMARSGALCYISHLDLLRCVQRTLRRADLPVQYSQGFNPHPILSFAQALGVGLQTKGDYFAVGLHTSMMPQALVQRFNGHAPKGLGAVAARAMADGEKSPMALVQAARYRLWVKANILQTLHEGTRKLMAMASYPIVKKEKQEDVRPLIHDVDFDAEGVRFLVSCGNENLSHKTIVDAVSQIAGLLPEDIKIFREELYTKNGTGVFVPLIDMHPSFKAGEHCGKPHLS